MVEVMIFLAISGAMLGWTVVAIRQRQLQVEFSQTVRDFENRIKDVINDIATGYYPNATGFECVVGSPNDANNSLEFRPVPAGVPTAGTNKDCIFIGKAIQFAPANTDESGFNVYTVLGRREYPQGVGDFREVGSLEEANPRALVNVAGGFDYTEKERLRWGVRIKASGTSSGLIGFFTTFAQSGQRGLESGSFDTQTVAIPQGGAPFPTQATESSAIGAIEALGDNAAPAFTPQTICLERSDGAETAKLIIGSNGRKIDVVTEFGGGGAPAC